MEAEVTMESALSMQVCVPDRWSDTRIVAFANKENPSGLEAGWAIRKQGDKLLDGKDERMACSRHLNKVHIMLDC